MENNKLEHLFNNKLDGYTIEPSQAAQKKFSRQILNQKRRIILYRVGIAATVVLLVTAGIYAFLPGDNGQVDLVVSDAYEIQGELAAPVVKPLPDQEVQTDAEKTFIALQETQGDLDGTPIDETVASSGQERIQDIADEPEIAIPDVSDSGPSGISEVPVTMLAAEVGRNTATENFQEDVLQNDWKQETVIQHEISGLEEQQREPIKITIEYIASGKNQGQSEPGRKNFYSRLDKMKTVEEVIGDIRTYKDRLFALDFNKEEKETKNENSEE